MKPFLSLFYVIEVYKLTANTSVHKLFVRLYLPHAQRCHEDVFLFLQFTFESCYLNRTFCTFQLFTVLVILVFHLMVKDKIQLSRVRGPFQLYIVVDLSKCEGFTLLLGGLALSRDHTFTLYLSFFVLAQS